MADQPEESGRQIEEPSHSKQKTGSYRVEKLPGVHLEVKVGGVIQLRLASGGLKYQGRVVGIEQFAFLIVLARISQDTMTQMVTAGFGVIAQHAVGGKVYGFKTELIKRITSPASLLFFAFPDSVDRIVLRKESRVQVSIPGRVQGKYGEHKVMVTDMGLTGCQFKANVTLNTPLRLAEADDRLVLNCDLGCSLPIVVPVLLKRIVLEGGSIFIGALFIDADQELLDKIVGYVGALSEFA